MEETIKQILEMVGLVCESVVGLCIAIGAAEAVFRVLFGGGLASPRAKKEIWIRFAAWIMLALEFALAADIVGTAVAPTWEAIGQLAVIATIRTALNFFLERDIRELGGTREQAEA